jgi:hypothetical protein
MALPPLELFSLKKRLPCCRVAFSFPEAGNRTDLYASREPRYNPTRHRSSRADVAQLVEQLIRNQQVIGSSPIVGSKYLQKLSKLRPHEEQPQVAFAFCVNTVSRSLPNISLFL